MTIPHMHVNQLGGYFVDLVEVSAKGDKTVKKVIETRNFETQQEASLYWFEMMNKGLRTEVEEVSARTDQPSVTIAGIDFSDSFDHLNALTIQQGDEGGK